VTGTGDSRMGYRVDVAPQGRGCESWQHDGRYIAAVVVTEDGSHLCLLHWNLVAAKLQRDGYRIDYTPAARLALRMGRRE